MKPLAPVTNMFILCGAAVVRKKCREEMRCKDRNPFYARTHGLYSYIERLLRTNVTRLGAVDHTQILLNKTETQ